MTTCLLYCANRNNPRLEDVLAPSNPKCLREFLFLCAKEFSDENLLFYLGARDYRRAPTRDKMNFLYTSFVKRDSELELNIPMPAVLGVEKRIKDYMELRTRYVYSRSDFNRAAMQEQPPGDIFDQAARESVQTFSDTFDRFRTYYMKRGPLGWSITKVSQSDCAARLPACREVIRAMHGLGFQLPATFLSV
jgi:hypothetical protein